MATKSLTFDLFGRDRTASSTIKTLGDNATTMGGRFKKAGVMAAAGLAAIAVGLVKFGADSVKAYSDAEEQQAKLAFAFKKFPALADTNQKALQKLNSELQKKTRFDDDATASAQATLAGFKLTGAQIKQLTPLLQDYATKTGKDLPTAADDLGKAMLGQGRALKAVGIQFTDTGTLGGNFAELVDGLTTKVGGLAVASGETAAGKLDILKQRFGEVQEKVGGPLTDVLTAFLDFFSITFMPGIEKAGKWFAKDGVKGLKDFGDFLVKYKDSLGPAAAAVGVLTGAQVALNVAMAANPVLLSIGALIGIVTAFGVAMNTNVKDAPEWAKGWVNGAHQITESFDLWVAKFQGGAQQWADFAAGVVVAWNATVAGFTNGANQISGWWNGLIGGFQNGANQIVVAWNATVAGFQNGAQQISDFFTNLGTLVSGFADLGSRAGTALINGVIAGINAAATALERAIKAVTGIKVDIPNLPGLPTSKPGTAASGSSGVYMRRMAAGGLVKHRPGGMLANIGEGRYDEMVTPLSPKVMQMLGGGGGGPRPVFNVVVSAKGGVDLLKYVDIKIEDASRWAGLEFDSGVGR